MKKGFFLFFSMILFVFQANATHQRAAEITYRYISGLTYEITLITYTYTPSPADRPQIEINWGDGTTSTVNRLQKIDMPDDISKNIYVAQHTFPSASTFHISMLDPNRNAGVINIPNSVNIPMYVETELVINPFLGNDNSPVLLNPPLDKGCVGKPFMHNAGAYDTDGDSLSYRLAICRGYDGMNIPGYSYPAGNIFRIDSVTGDLLWDSPLMEGEYNVAFLIEEWRDGVKIGYITRDMQITITSCNNDPPVIRTISDTCVEAGSPLSFTVTATDPNPGQRVTLTATGGPLFITESPASFNQPVSGIGSVSSDFNWQTVCNHVRKNSYSVFFKAADNGEPVSLVSYKTLNIRVVGPSPKNLTAVSLGISIKLNWNKSSCSNAIGYEVFRRSGYYGFIPGYCETGVPAYTGYVKIADVNGLTDTTFTDNNNGAGLIHGIDYCYMVVAFYPDGAESYASLEACAYLKKDVPVITNISVRNTHVNNGSMYIAWSKPTEIDTLLIPGPYKYLLYRSEGSLLDNPVKIDSLNSLNDTLYTDTLLNTRLHSYSYRIDFINNTHGNRFLVGYTHRASSVYIDILPTDRALKLQWNENVPWLNERYIIYRQNPVSLLFDSIGLTTFKYYTDTGLVNGIIYCYKIKSSGKYNAPGFINPIINFSQINCGTPVDNVPPCPPVLDASTDCVQNTLTWNNLLYACAHDILQFNILYSPSNSGDFTRIDSTRPFVTTYTHQNLVSVAGCYAIMAIDSLQNQSSLSNIVCISGDSCPDYHLPNVFTPNGDGKNDLFIPFPYSNVESINLTIYNRWGTPVFETTDPNINWDGKDRLSRQDCSGGVYFYVCDVYIRRLNGTLRKSLTGTIQLIR